MNKQYAIQAAGLLVEIESVPWKADASKFNKTAKLLSGSYVDEIAVSYKVNGDLDELVGKQVVLGCRYVIKWKDHPNGGGRYPDRELVVMEGEQHPQIPGLQEVAA